MLGPDVALSQLSMNASPSGIILNNGSGAAIAVRITFHIINWILWVAKTYFYLFIVETDVNNDTFSRRATLYGFARPLIT